MRQFVILCALATLLHSPSVMASDFEEAKQDVPVSASHASMQTAETREAYANASATMLAAVTAHRDCLAAALKRDDSEVQAARSCRTTRASVVALLPAAFANMEMSIIEQRLMSAAAATDQ